MPPQSRRQSARSRRFLPKDSKRGIGARFRRLGKYRKKPANVGQYSSRRGTNWPDETKGLKVSSMPKVMPPPAQAVRIISHMSLVVISGLTATSYSRPSSPNSQRKARSEVRDASRCSDAAPARRDAKACRSARYRQARQPRSGAARPRPGWRSCPGRSPRQAAPLHHSPPPRYRFLVRDGHIDLDCRIGVREVGQQWP